ncbi:RPM1-interacting protein 4-like isoform X4 [Carica papaya]|nr:RPM1-interacting protein 4-like isoform X4 [Carica papaya]XP_021894284.1 RPM1-interacting protein 4-like isoform X4 [Carica papaya]
MKIDLSDAQQNLGTYSSNKSPVRDPHSQTKAKTRAEGVPNAVMTKTEHCANREDDLNRPTESTLYHPVIARPHSQGQGRRVTSSPLHSHGGAKVGGEGSGMSSPSWERKGSSENNTHGLAPLTPTRSRLRAVNRGNESPDQSASIPKFGDWNEADPASSDGYSQIFGKYLEERQSGVRNAAVPTETSYANIQKHPRNENSKRFCCFPWSGK